MRRLLFLLWISFLVFSCSKNEVEENSPAAGVVLLKKLTANDLGRNTVYQFYYNGTKLKKVYYQTEGMTINTWHNEFEYTGNLITSVKCNGIGKNVVAYIINVDLSYDGAGRLSQVSEIRNEGGNTYNSIYRYNYNDDGSVEINVGANETQGDFHMIEKYYFENGEIIRYDSFWGDTPITNLYKYDNANNSMQNVMGLDKIKLYMIISNGFYGFYKNRTDTTFKLSSGVETDHVHLDAVYNKDNYPESLISSPSSPGPFAYYYEYY